MQYKSYPVISAYRKSSIKPPVGGYFKPTLREGLIEPGGYLRWRNILFRKTKVSVIKKNYRKQSGKA